MSAAKRRKKVVALLERDGADCHVCGEPILFHIPNHPWSLTIDHLTPLAHGGGNRLSNLRLAHRFCNGLRGAESPETARAWLRSAPFTSRSTPE